MFVMLEWSERRTGKRDCRLSMGDSRDSLELVGVLTVTLEQAQALHHTIRAGIAAPGCTDIRERGQLHLWGGAATNGGNPA